MKNNKTIAQSKRIIYLTVVAMLLPSCAQKTYVNNGVSQAQSNMDKTSCELFATQSMRSNQELGTVGPISGLIEREHLIDDCLSTKGYTIKRQ
ncbi:MAG: hypothetical protein Q8L15_02290 [Methylobacter sp.]|nr:hypothetical protein [Methylobacter sp.]